MLLLLKKYKSELTVILIGVVLTVTVLLFGFFDSPRFYNDLEAIRQNNTESTASFSAEKGKIDLNNSGIDELSALYGIGKSKARAIIEYRRKIGGFMSVDELTNISGISEKILEKNRDLITIGPYTEDDYEIQSD